MTGDGVNDTLALKDADLGIAMGAGTSAAKSVAELVLLDNRFATLPGVVAEGRRVIANIERVARLFVTKTVWAATFAVIIGVCTTSYPLIPRQLTVVDALTIGIPGLRAQLRAEPRAGAAGLPAAGGSVLRAGGDRHRRGVDGASSACCAASSVGADRVAAQSGTTLVLTALGLVALYELMRPLDRLRAGLLAVLVVMGVGAFTIPFVADFFSLQVPAGDQARGDRRRHRRRRGRHRARGALRGPHRRRRRGGRPAVPALMSVVRAASPRARTSATSWRAGTSPRRPGTTTCCRTGAWTSCGRRAAASCCAGRTRTGGRSTWPPGGEMAGVRFRPGAASGVFGVAAGELVDRRVPLADLLGARPARLLAARLDEAADGAARMAAFEELVRRAGDAADPIDELAARRSPPIRARRCDALADGPGCRPRQLRRRFDRAVGYGPAFLARVARLQRFAKAAVRSPELGLAELAAAAGYADQSHLGQGHPGDRRPHAARADRRRSAAARWPSASTSMADRYKTAAARRAHDGRHDRDRRPLPHPRRRLRGQGRRRRARRLVEPVAVQRVDRPRRRRPRRRRPRDDAATARDRAERGAERRRRPAGRVPGRARRPGSGARRPGAAPTPSTTGMFGRTNGRGHHRPVHGLRPRRARLGPGPGDRPGRDDRPGPRSTASSTSSTGWARRRCARTASRAPRSPCPPMHRSRTACSACSDATPPDHASDGWLRRDDRRPRPAAPGRRGAGRGARAAPGRRCRRRWPRGRRRRARRTR